MKFAQTCLASLLLSISCVAGLLDGLGLESTVSKEEKNFTCTPLPEAKPPAQHSSAEGIPPLPLPAVPLRRTEKKNPPRPPVLIAKIATKRESDWATNPSDIKNLLKWMAKEFNVHFSTVNVPQSKILTDPTSIPVIYRTGHEAFTFPDDVRERLRFYVTCGGTIIFDACCGRCEFFESALRETQKIVPERPAYRLDADHPIYRSFFDVKHIGYRPWAIKAGAVNDQPSCIGVDIGCRTAIFIFRWDMSCGWDGLEDSEHHHCLGYDIPTARKIGTNLMAYITAERSVAIPLSRAVEYVDAAKGRTGKFAIAQVKYDGIWKTRDIGLCMLLNTFYEQTKVPVRFETDEISLTSTRLYDFPFIYMTGHGEVHMPRKSGEGANLSSFLDRGGFVLVEACCGREVFDKSFRKLVSRNMGGRKLERVPTNHPIFRAPYNIQTVMLRPALAKIKNAPTIPPEIYGITTENGLSLVYSPYGLSCGWELSECPYCMGLDKDSSLKLGTNILYYAILQ